MHATDPGFSIHPDVLAPDELNGIATALGGWALRSRAGARHLMAHPVVSALARDARLLTLAQAAVGKPARPYRATLFDKSRASNWLVVWHQDTALPLRARHDAPGWGPWSTKAGVVYAHAPATALQRVVALRVHLDDSAPDNGPLRVLPGTHTLGVLSDAAIHALARQVPAFECTVSRGGVILMRPLLLHASSKALAPARRRVLHLEYTATFHFEPGLELHVA